jgi:hypothetical protein
MNRVADHIGGSFLSLGAFGHNANIARLKSGGIMRPWCLTPLGFFLASCQVGIPFVVVTTLGPLNASDRVSFSATQTNCPVSDIRISDEHATWERRPYLRPQLFHSSYVYSYSWSVHCRDGNGGAERVYNCFWESNPDLGGDEIVEGPKGCR